MNTNQVTNYHCVGSKDNRYIAIAAYTPEVKIFEVTREKNGTFKKVNKIMTLQGHRVRLHPSSFDPQLLTAVFWSVQSGVLDLAFNGSEALPVNQVVTMSKDASIRLWGINGIYLLIALRFDELHLIVSLSL